MEPKEVIDNNSKVTRNVIITIGSVLFGILALIAVYQILKHYMHVDLVKFAYDLFMLKYLPTLGNDSSYGLLFILGVLTSVHCIGMCGGIAMSQTINKGENLKGKKRDIKGLMLPSALYNFGRVISYTFIGGLVGGLGQILSFNGVMKGIVPIVGGVLMIIMGIKLLGIFPQLRRFNIPVPSFVAKKLVSQNSYTPFIVGILTGLMPCGPLQIVQLYALGTRSVFIGALSMFVFSLGTLPALFIFLQINN
jgi:sulfite exporter TauE/SafE